MFISYLWDKSNKVWFQWESYNCKHSKNVGTLWSTSLDIPTLINSPTPPRPPRPLPWLMGCVARWQVCNLLRRDYVARVNFLLNYSLMSRTMWEQQCLPLIYGKVNILKLKTLPHKGMLQCCIDHNHHSTHVMKMWHLDLITVPSRALKGEKQDVSINTP